MYVAWDYVCPTYVCLMAFIYSYCVADKKKAVVSRVLALLGKVEENSKQITVHQQ